MKIEAALHNNYFWYGREWPYRDLQPRIIAEEYMEDSEDRELRDYKFFTFNGEPKLLFVSTDRQDSEKETKFDFFDMDYNHLDIKSCYPNSVVPPSKPENFELMKDIARRLAQGTKHLRVDLYEVNGRVYFGELTFYFWSGFMPFEPKEWELRLGEWIEL